MKEILDQILPTLVQAIVSILGILISFIATKAISYLTTKKAEVVSKIGAQQYNFSVSVAESIFYAVEQQMKSASGAAKRDEFNKRIAAKIPGITADDIEHLREAIVGKTKGLTKIITEKVPVPVVTPPMPWNNPVIYGSNTVTHPVADTTGVSFTTTSTPNEGIVNVANIHQFDDEVPKEDTEKDI